MLRMHWAERKKVNDTFTRAVWIAKNQVGLYGRPEYCPVTIDIELRLWGQTEMDEDNAVGACKPIIDALVLTGILKGDDPASVTKVTVTQRRTPRYKAGAQIVITPEG
jgi:hypothetical protein